MKTKLTFALVAALTSTAFAAFQAPLPEFKNEKQLAEWRAEKASEATSQGYAADVSAFYTGKPYLVSSGSYAFKYRSYSPEVARWTSEDPSGFPDGANASIYNNDPLSGFDPNGLAWGNIAFIYHFYTGEGNDVQLSTAGLLQEVIDVAERSPSGGAYRFENQIRSTASQSYTTGATTFSDSFSNSYSFSSVLLAFGAGVLDGNVTGTYGTPNTNPITGERYVGYTAIGTINYTDDFTDPSSLIEALYGSSSSPSAPSWLAAAAQFGGTPYKINGSWSINVGGEFLIE